MKNVVPIKFLIKSLFLHKLVCGSEIEIKNFVFDFVFLSPCTNFLAKIHSFLVKPHVYKKKFDIFALDLHYRDDKTFFIYDFAVSPSHDGMGTGLR